MNTSRELADEQEIYSSSREGFLRAPRRYSWEVNSYPNSHQMSPTAFRTSQYDAQQRLHHHYYQHQQPNFDNSLVQDAFTAVDLLVAVAQAETRRLRNWVLMHFDHQRLWNAFKENVNKLSIQGLLSFFRLFIGNGYNRVFEGNEVLSMNDLALLDETNHSFSDDDDETGSMRAVSTIVSSANDKRISDLEQELATLRQAINVLMNKRTEPTETNIPTPIAEKTTGKIPPVSKVAPRAPPPPPLDLFKKPTVAPTKIIEATEDIENKAPIELKKQAPTLADALKDLGSVKLRKVARTPGGTPIREKDSNVGDNSLMAALLRRKAACGTVDVDSNPIDDDEDEWS